MNLPGLLSIKSWVEKAADGDADAKKKVMAELQRMGPTVKPHTRQIIEELIQIGQPASGSHMGSVVKKVKELKPGMEETLKRLRADEVQSKHQYQMVQQGLLDEKKAQQKILDSLDKEQGQNTKDLAQNQQDL